MVGYAGGRSRASVPIMSSRNVLSGLTSSKVKVGNLALEFESRLTLEDIEGDNDNLRLSEARREYDLWSMRVSSTD